MRVTPRPVLGPDKTQVLGVMPAMIEVRVRGPRDDAPFRLVTERLMPLPVAQGPGR